MKTDIVAKEAIDKMIHMLNDEKIIAFPTETVYGLAAKYGSIKALNRLFEAKMRPMNKSITMMLSNIEDIQKYAKVTLRDEKVISAFMPGAITVILNKKDDVPLEMTCGKTTLGIRIPDDAFVRELIDRIGCPLMVTSANISGKPDCITSQDVLTQLDGKIDLIVEGESGHLLPSSVVDLTREKIQLLRQGDLTLDQINQIWI